MATPWSLQQLANEKEGELQSLREQQTQLLEETVKVVRNDLLSERERLQQLQTDFEYNLSLLEQRDKELSRYDTAFSEVKSVVNSLVAENSELKVRLDSAHQEISREKENYQQMKTHYIHRLEEQQTQMDAYRQSKDQEVESERQKLEGLQRELQQRMLELEGELRVQRDQMSAEFDEVMKKREREHSTRVNEFSTALLSRDAQLKQLSRELHLARSSQEQTKEDAGREAQEVSRLEKELRELRWEMEDQVNARDARVAELEGQLAHAQSGLKAAQGDYERRRVEMDRQAREKESALQACKESHRESELQLEKHLREVQVQLEQKEVELRRQEWCHGDQMEEKRRETERLLQQLLQCREECDVRVGEVEREGVERYLQLQSLQDTCDKLKVDLQKRTDDIEHYKRELSLSVERERSLERSKAQLDLDWEGRVGETERQAYSKHQEIIKQLTTARDQALAQCRELQETVSQQCGIVQAVQRERDVAIATLGRHGLTEDYQAACGEGVASSHVTDPRDHVIQQLRQRNEELCVVIRQMRSEMEEITDWSEHPTNHITDKEHGQVLTHGYVKYMENEVLRLKTESRELSERLQEGRKPPPSGDKRKPPSPRRESQHRSHLIALSDTIASLQRERQGMEVEALQLRSELEEKEKTIAAFQEQVYLLRAVQVPKSKLHTKLLQATQVIIALVREKEQLVQQMRSLQTQITSLKQELTAGPDAGLQQPHHGVGTHIPKARPPQSLTTSIEQQPHGHSAMDGPDTLRLRSKLSSKNGAVVRHLNSVEHQGYTHTRQQLRQGSPPKAVLSKSALIHRAVSGTGQQTDQHRARTAVVEGPSDQHDLHVGVPSEGQKSAHSSEKENVKPPPQSDIPQQLDISLHSLRFTDTSELEDEESILRVFQSIDREPLSSTLQSNDHDIVGQAIPGLKHHPSTSKYRSSSPVRKTSECITQSTGNSLQLKGSKMSGAVRTAVAKQPKKVEGQLRRKPRIRNYNIKDN